MLVHFHKSQTTAMARRTCEGIELNGAETDTCIETPETERTLKKQHALIQAWPLLWSLSRFDGIRNGDVRSQNVRLQILWKSAKQERSHG